MESNDVVYTLLYGFFAFIFVAPPAEIVSAGVTAENLFSFWLKTEQQALIQYHIRKTTLFRFLHTLVFPGYFVAMHFLSEFWNLNEILYFDALTKALITASLALPICVGIQCFIWWRSKWNNHPLVINIKALNADSVSWREVANAVNMEYRAIDKFLRRQGPELIVATEHWIVKVGAYNGWVVHQSDVRLEVSQTDQHNLTVNAESDLSVTQYLRLTVHSYSRRRPIFTIRIAGADFEELKEKVLHPIRIRQDVVLLQSVEERFMVELQRVVDSNPVFHKPADMECDQCIGCMQKVADVKLVKTCQSNDCRSCFCRPMWCFDCLARWFASQQRRRNIEVNVWMSQPSTCPTCRSAYCVLDICRIQENR